MSLKSILNTILFLQIIAGLSAIFVFMCISFLVCGSWIKSYLIYLAIISIAFCNGFNLAKGKSGSKAKMEGELLIDFGGSKQEKKDDGWGNSWDDEAWESLNK